MERLSELGAAGVTEEDFAVWPLAYKFITQYAEQYGGVPDPALLKGKFEGWDPPGGEFSYWLEEFIRYGAARKAGQFITAAIPALARDPDTAITELVAKLASVQYARNHHILATDSSITDRVAKYHARRQVYESSNGRFLYGISSGLEVIDRTHQGWMAGELVGFYARPTVGKTWMLVREAAIAWSEGFRVLLISPEVSAAHIALRIDVFLAHALGINLSHSGIFEGNPDQRLAYESLAKQIQESQRWWTVDSIQGRPLGLRDIRKLVQELEPDMVCIDGVMLLQDDERAQSSWERMDHLCYGLKNMATAMDLIIMISHQAVNSRKGQRGDSESAGGRGDDWIMPTLNDAAGGEAFVRGCSSIFTMCPDQKYKNLRWYSVRKTRERDIKDWKPRYALGWDVDHGNIEDLSRYGTELNVIIPQLPKVD